jgi:VWFA-related protein
MLCVLCVLGGSTYVTAAAQQLFRSTVDGVAIPVTVKTGNTFVSGLKAGDFEVRDNGVVQKVEALDANVIPLDLTILLDTSTSVDGGLLQQLKFAVVDITAQLHDSDRMRLIAVSQVLEELIPWRSRHDAVPLDSLGAEGGLSLYDALVVGMIRRADAGRRQLVIAFTDGRDSTSIFEEADTGHIARMTDTVVDVVMPLTSDEKPPDKMTTSLRELNRTNGTPAELAARARDMKPWEVKEALVSALDGLVNPTGGKVFTFEANQSVGRQFRRVLDDYRAGYVVEYVPTGVAAEGWHEITVSVTKPGKYEVRARKGYQHER